MIESDKHRKDKGLCHTIIAFEKKQMMMSDNCKKIGSYLSEQQMVYSTRFSLFATKSTEQLAN